MRIKMSLNKILDSGTKIKVLRFLCKTNGEKYGVLLDAERKSLGTGLKSKLGRGKS